MNSAKRVLQESKGSTDYIGDEIGQHLEYNDIQMPDFLTKQMINRIRFKFTQSDFPPRKIMKKPSSALLPTSPVIIILKISRKCTPMISGTKKKMIFTPKQLDFFGEDKPKDEDQKSKGKLIHIIFEDGKTTFKEQ